MEGFFGTDTEMLAPIIPETESEVPFRLYVGLIYLVIGLILYLGTH